MGKDPESGGSGENRIQPDFPGRDEMDSGESDQIFSFNPRDDKLIRKAMLPGQGKDLEGEESRHRNRESI